MTRLFIISLALALGAMTAPAQAINWIPVLKNTAFERFDEEDLQLFLDTSRKVLNEAPDGETVSWENPNTKHRGDMTVLKTTEHDGKKCRLVRVRNEADGRKGNTRVNVCNINGKWRISSSR